MQPSRQSDQPIAADYSRGRAAARQRDAQRHHLFLAHLGDSAVLVFDTVQRKVIATIPDVSRVHGVLYVPQLDRVYASATGPNKVVAIDAKTFKIIARARWRLPGRNGLMRERWAYVAFPGVLMCRSLVLWSLRSREVLPRLPSLDRFCATRSSFRYPAATHDPIS